MQLTGLAAEAKPPVVVNTVCKVAVLLDFGDEYPATYGVDKPSRYEKAVAGLDFNKVQSLSRYPRFKRSFKVLFSAALAKTVDYTGAGFGVNDIPHLGFAKITFDMGGVLIVGVHLD